MAEQRTRRRKAEKAEKADPQPTLFVILRVDELPALPDDAEPGAVNIGERLTVVKAVHSKRDRHAVARDYRAEKEAEWQAARATGSHPDYPDGLPEHFPRHLYRVVAVSYFNPGHFAEETRGVAFGTF